MYRWEFGVELGTSRLELVDVDLHGILIIDKQQQQQQQSQCNNDGVFNDIVCVREC